MWDEILPTGNPRLHGVIPSYGTSDPQRYLLGDPLWRVLRMSAEQIGSKWSLSGWKHSILDPPDGGPETGW